MIVIEVSPAITYLDVYFDASPAASVEDAAAAVDAAVDADALTVTAADSAIKGHYSNFALNLYLCCNY